MNKNILTLALLCVSFGYAQFNSGAPWMKELETKRKSTSTPLKFNEIVEAFNTYWKDKDHTVKGSGYKPFKRWENFWETKLNPDGTLVTYEQIVQAMAQKNQNKNVLADESNWLPLGPTDFLTRTTSGANLGRINAILVDPNNDQIYYAGAPAGGLWKSTDAGSTWLTLTDDLPQIGVSAIAVDPLDSNTIYIGTGDDDANDTYSIGLLKSTDGGQTWNATDLTFANTSSNISEVYLDRAGGNNTIYVSTSSGFYKSTDGGTSFTRTLIEDLNDMKVKPGDPNVVYAVSDSKFYKSTDAGDTFTQITSGFPGSSSRLVLDVTPANPDYVYVLSALNSATFQGIYKSINSGDTFTKTANTTNLFEVGQAWYDLAIAVSDTDPEEIYTGELNIWKSSNGGDSFTRINNSNSRNASYTHADIHFLRFFNGKLFCGSDGGIFESPDGGVNFTDKTVGMNISQFYRVAVSKQNSQKIAGGTQDNGSFGLTTSGQWNAFNSVADGMDTAIDPNNQNLYYAFMQNGSRLFVSNNAGETLTSLVNGPRNSDGNWITPLDVNAEGEVYAAYSALFKLEEGVFNKISSDFAGEIDELEIDPNDSNIIYVSRGGTLYKSIDKGVDFNSIGTAFSSEIVAIEVQHDNGDVVYVVTGGTNGGVFKSINGGSNFTDITGNLPNIPKLEIEHQALHPDNPLYVGTHIGVYRIDDTMTNWEVFENNLPNVPIRDLEINAIDGNITAATYGRGIWQSTIPLKMAENDVALKSIEALNTDISCSFNPSITILNNGLNPITSVDIEYILNGEVNTTTWTGNLVTMQTEIVELPSISNLNFGTNNSFKVSVSIPNEVFVVNNSLTTSLIGNNAGTNNVRNEFETANDDLLSIDQTLWQRGVPTGLLLNSASSGQNVYATNLTGNYTDQTVAQLVSQCYDLSSIENPVLEFRMAFDLEQDWDFMNVEYTLDNGRTWNVLGTANDPNWYNSDRVPDGNDCFNCVGAQWTGRDLEMKNYIYDLVALASETSFIFRFNFVSDQSVNEEGVIIDDLFVGGATLGVDEFREQTGFVVHPNPSKDIFTIQWKNANEVSYEVFDITGKRIVSNTNVNVSNNQGQVDLSGYARGMYFLKITIDNLEENIKLMKK